MAIPQEELEIGNLETVYPRFYLDLPNAGEADITLSSEDSSVENRILAGLSNQTQASPANSAVFPIRVLRRLWVRLMACFWPLR